MNDSRLQTAARCALADLIGEYEKGGLPEAAMRTILELHAALSEAGVDLDDYSEKVAEVNQYVQSGPHD